MENIIYLGQKSCEICQGYCFDLIDISFMILMSFVIYKIVEAVFK